MTIRFKTSKEESHLINQIVERAKIVAAAFMEFEELSLQMDITATHCNGCPLRLRELLAADDFNFTHDVVGISRHLDRATGQLGGCFSPRFSQPQPASVE